MLIRSVWITACLCMGQRNIIVLPLMNTASQRMYLQTLLLVECSFSLLLSEIANISTRKSRVYRVPFLCQDFEPSSVIVSMFQPTSRKFHCLHYEYRQKTFLSTVTASSESWRTLYFVILSIQYKSRVSSVSIVSGYGLDDRTIEVRSPAEAKEVSCNLCVQTGSGAHPASCTMGTGSPFPRG
jgi:hypothetical protein